jgi:hypothetical protein
MVGGLRSLIMAFPMPVPGYFFKKSDLLHSIVTFFVRVSNFGSLMGTVTAQLEHRTVNLSELAQIVHTKRSFY